MSADRYTPAADAARAALATRSARDIAERSGAEAVAGGLELVYFAQPVTVTLPGLDFSPDPGEMERLLVMHYLAASGPTPPPGGWSSFHQLPAASFYAQPFRRRATDRILRSFGSRPGELGRAGAALGAAVGDVGDESILLVALPRVEVMVVMHRGDEDLGPEAGMMFRNNITAFFGLEDVAVLGTVIATRLSRAL